MLSPSAIQPVNHLAALEYAIMSDIRSIDDMDDFLTVDNAEDGILALLCEQRDFDFETDF